MRARSVRARICPVCCDPMRKHGRAASGSQRWRCTACNPTATAPRAVPPARTEQVAPGEFIAWAASKGARADQPGGARALALPHRPAGTGPTPRPPARGRGARPDPHRWTPPGQRVDPPGGREHRARDHPSVGRQREHRRPYHPAARPGHRRPNGSHMVVQPTPAPATPTSAWSARPSRERCSPT